MEEYILQILQKSNRLIIPGFGAFIVMRRKPLTVVFNEFLQHSDKELIDTIISREKCTDDEAKEKITQFICQINNKLDIREPFKFKELGSLIKTPSGKITFKNPTLNDDEANLLIVKEFDLEIDEKSNQSKKVKDKKTSSRKVEKQKVSSAPKTDISKKKEAVTEKKYIETRIKHINKQEDTDIADIQKPYTTSPRAKVDHRPSSISIKSAFIWTALILMVAGLIGYYYYAKPSLNIQNYGLRKLISFTKTDTLESTIIEDLAEADTLLAEADTQTNEPDYHTSPPVEPEITAETKTVIEPVPQIKTEIRKQEKVKRGYYIIAGVFKSEENAERFAKGLRKKGFNAEKFGKVGELYGVCYDNFTSKAEADTALNKIKREIDNGAWIKFIE